MANKICLYNGDLIFTNINNINAIINIDTIGYININNNIITNVKSPINDYDVANKIYVDNKINNDKGRSNGIATLDSNTKVPMEQINDDIKTFIYVIDDISERDNIIKTQGAIVDVINETSTYVYDRILGWVKISSKSDVLSVNGYKDNVILTTNDINEKNNLYYTRERFLNDINNITSNNIIEGTTNLYYTDNRVSNNHDVITCINHTNNLLNPHNVTKEQLGLSNVTNIKNNYNAIFDPINEDDDTKGYNIGSKWINTITNYGYVCVNNTTSNAVWKIDTVINTDDLIEGNNKFYTHNRFDYDFNAKSTSDLVEGVNLYYTNTRFNLDFENKTTDELAEGINNLYFTDSRVNNNTNVTLNSIHRQLFNNPHNVTKDQVGLGYIHNIKSNINAQNGPNEHNDINQGYSIGSQWIDIINKREYVCLDAKENSAIWKLISGPIDYDAIVDIGGNGDYISISDAFNAGNRSVFIKQGYYYETADIVMPDGGVLVGEAAGLVYIIFMGPYSIKIDGSNGKVETQGTISIGTNTQIVIGNETKFTNLKPGNYILLNGVYHLIGMIMNDNMLAISHMYVGTPIINDLYIAQNMLVGNVLRNFIIVNSLTVGLYIRASYHIAIDTITVMSCQKNIELRDCGSGVLTKMVIMNAKNNGIEIYNSYGLCFSISEVIDNSGDGICIYDTSLLVVNSIMSNCNLKNGIYFGHNVSKINLVNCIFNDNNECGLLSEINTHSINISDTVIFNNGKSGLVLNGQDNLIADATIINNNEYGAKIGNLSGLSNCNIKNNKFDGVYVIGTNNISGNYITNNGGNGIFLLDSNSSISGNYIISNKLHGINIIHSDNSMINGNYISSSGKNGINIKESGCVLIMNNKISLSEENGCCNTIDSIRTIIETCVLTENKGDGLCIEGDDCFLLGNIATMNMKKGCFISNEVHNTYIFGNRFYDNIEDDFVDEGTLTSVNVEYITNIDSRINKPLIIGETNATHINISQNNKNTNILGSLNIMQNLNINGTINGTNYNTIIDNINNHLTDYINPHKVTKSQIGLSNVSNVQQIPMTFMGIQNGVATLDNNTKIYSSQLYKYDSYGFSTNTNSPIYTKLFQFIYMGTNYNNIISSIKFIGYMEQGAQNYSVRIYDYTNNNNICEVINLANNNQQIIDMGNINNLPINNSILEVHAKITGNKLTNCYLLGLLCIY